MSAKRATVTLLTVGAFLRSRTTGGTPAPGPVAARLPNDKAGRFEVYKALAQRAQNRASGSWYRLHVSQKGTSLSPQHGQSVPPFSSR
jgi:hypothetical protein